MIRLLSLLLLMCSTVAVWSDVVVPTRTIRANAIVSDVDVGMRSGTVTNGFDRVADVIGQEARTTLYAGRPILVDDVGPPALVARNQIVSLRFQSNGLLITTEGRSLQRGGVGDVVRVMNLTSRATLFGQVQADGSVEVKR